MNASYISLSNILQELLFKRHRFFNPIKSAERNRKEMERLKNKRLYLQKISIQKAQTNAAKQTAKRKPIGVI